MTTLREEVAQAIYDKHYEGLASDIKWGELNESIKDRWRSKADAAVAVVDAYLDSGMAGSANKLEFQQNGDALYTLRIKNPPPLGADEYYLINKAAWERARQGTT